MNKEQVERLSNETLGTMYEQLFALLGTWGEIQTVYGWEQPQWVIEAETLFLQIEGEMVIRVATIPLPPDDLGRQLRGFYRDDVDGATGVTGTIGVVG